MCMYCLQYKLVLQRFVFNIFLSISVNSFWNNSVSHVPIFEQQTIYFKKVIL